MEHNIYQIASGTKYPADAFFFVQRGLEYTVNGIHGEAPQSCTVDEEELAGRHITGQSLCIGLREYAIECYGLLARTVLRSWRIHTCEDFGHIVFAMVDAGLMRKTDEDSIEDFTNVFDFAEAFSRSLDLTESVSD